MDRGVKYPFTPGNESAATVQSLGEEVADEKKRLSLSMRTYYYIVG
jgi:NADPH:quinone reductase-like Zn-dependent oxidoreductase